MNEEKMREEFEVLIKYINFPLKRKGEGYRSSYTDNMWLAYKSSCASRQREIDSLIEALQAYATCSDGCTCGDGWSHTTAKDALFILKGEPK